MSQCSAKRESLLFISQIQKCMALSLLRNVHIRPTVPLFHFLNELFLLCVHLQVHPSQEETKEELHREQYKDGNLPWNVVRRIFRLEDLRAYDVSDTECREGHGVESDFLGMSAGVTCVVCVDDAETAAESEHNVVCCRWVPHGN